jgi:hypothetical protein
VTREVVRREDEGDCRLPGVLAGRGDGARERSRRGTNSAHDGTTTLPTQPTEKFVFGRRVGRSQRRLQTVG